MSKDKHTPGPWHYGGHTNIYAYYQRFLLHSRVVACVPFDAAGLDGGKKERQANARLIAAAPETAAERDRLREVNAELLAALKDMVTACECASSPKCDHCSKSRAAIAKAEGKS